MRYRFQLNQQPHQGISLPAIIVCLFAVSVIVFGALRFSLRLHRQARQDRLLEQARWVLDAGVSRAVSALQTNPEYRGEIIQVKSPVNEYRPTVSIQVKKLNERAAADTADSTPASAAGQASSASKPVLLVDVVARLERVDATPIEFPVQRSLRFHFLPSADR